MKEREAFPFRSSLFFRERGTAMSNRGTASTGSWVEFAASVFRQLPRPEEIDTATCEGWQQNQEALKRALAEALLPPVEAPDLYLCARLILGKDFIPAEEIGPARKLTYSTDQRAMFAAALPCEKELGWLRDNDCILVAGPPRPTCILEIRDMNPSYFYAKTGGWYAGDCEKFSRTNRAYVEWLGLRKGPVPGSVGENWSKQLGLLVSGVERVPNVAEAAWGVTTYKAVRGIYLLKGIFARTCSVSSGGNRVGLGYFGQHGLDVSSFWDSGGDIGLASAKIFNPPA